MVETENQQEENVWDVLKADIENELQQANQELQEINLKLKQSQLMVKKLAQNNASITAHLQQVQGQFDSLPRSDIRKAYDSALDAQQRLFVMRGQLEKLESDQANLEHFTATIERVLQVLDSSTPIDSRTQGTTASAGNVEMMIQAQEEERQRLSRKMHDGPAQALSNFILQTDIAVRLFDIDQSKAKEELADLKMSATSAFQKVRDFIFELRPMMLDDLGLVPTLKRYVDAYKEKPGMEIHLSVVGMERRLEPYLEVMIFRAVQELISYASRQSQASQVKVQVDMGENNIRVTVDDNGKGFDVETMDEPRNMGLKLIQERVEMLEGYYEMDSVAGQGTRVTFQIPSTAASRLT